MKRAESQPESDESSGTSDEIEQTLGKIRRRDEVHRLNAAKLPEGGLDASTIAEGDRKRKKTNKKRVQSPTSTIGDMLDRLLNFPPLQNQAAEARVKTLGKWETKIGLLSSSDTD